MTAITKSSIVRRTRPITSAIGRGDARLVDSDAFIARHDARDQQRKVQRSGPVRQGAGVKCTDRRREFSLEPHASGDARDRVDVADIALHQVQAKILQRALDVTCCCPSTLSLRS